MTFLLNNDELVAYLELRTVNYILLLKVWIFYLFVTICSKSLLFSLNVKYFVQAFKKFKS
jgi:hypothetical protein